MTSETGTIVIYYVSSNISTYISKTYKYKQITNIIHTYISEMGSRFSGSLVH
jgi:hypothetical protein